MGHIRFKRLIMKSYRQLEMLLSGWGKKLDSVTWIWKLSKRRIFKKEHVKTKMSQEQNLTQYTFWQLSIVCGRARASKGNRKSHQRFEKRWQQGQRVQEW